MIPWLKDILKKCRDDLAKTIIIAIAVAIMGLFLSYFGFSSAQAFINKILSWTWNVLTVAVDVPRIWLIFIAALIVHVILLTIWLRRTDHIFTRLYSQIALINMKMKEAPPPPPPPPELTERDTNVLKLIVTNSGPVSVGILARQLTLSTATVVRACEILSEHHLIHAAGRLNDYEYTYVNETLLYDSLPAGRTFAEKKGWLE